jgi:hypothetical protein
MIPPRNMIWTESSSQVQGDAACATGNAPIALPPPSKEAEIHNVPALPGKLGPKSVYVLGARLHVLQGPAFNPSRKAQQHPCSNIFLA